MPYTKLQEQYAIKKIEIYHVGVAMDAPLKKSAHQKTKTIVPYIKPLISLISTILFTKA